MALVPNSLSLATVHQEINIDNYVILSSIAIAFVLYSILLATSRLFAKK